MKMYVAVVAIVGGLMFLGVSSALESLIATTKTSVTHNVK
jgi:hypothetical protein